MEMKYLLVGDMHTKLDSIEESRRLIVWITKEAKKLDATPIFLGDQYDGQAIIRSEVLEFWVWAYAYMNNALSGDEDKVSTISLTGNHDLNSDSSASAMSAHEKQTTVAASHLNVDKNYLPIGEMAAIGFVRDNQQFIDLANLAAANGCKTILCHAEFNGAQYDNGFWAPNGIDITKLPKGVQFISGHIHKAQAYDNINYIGTPRHLTRSDIGETKGITLFSEEKDGLLLGFIPTPKEVSEPFTYMEVTQESQLKDIPASSRTYVDIKGTPEMIKKLLRGIPETAKVRTFPDQNREAITVKESDGIASAFGQFAEKHFEDNNTPAALRLKAIKLIYDKCPILMGAVDG
jgi:DNA repair exonuclease SbcCD nuclease subunit